MGNRRTSLAEKFLHLLKGLPVNYCRVVVLKTDDLVGVFGLGFAIALVLPVPKQGSSIDLILEDVVDAVLIPRLA